MRRSRAHVSALPCPPSVRTVVDRRVGEVIIRVVELEKTVAALQTQSSQLTQGESHANAPSPAPRESEIGSLPGSAFSDGAKDAPSATSPPVARSSMSRPGPFIQAETERINDWVIARVDSN